MAIALLHGGRLFCFLCGFSVGREKQLCGYVTWGHSSGFTGEFLKAHLFSHQHDTYLAGCVLLAGKVVS